MSRLTRAHEAEREHLTRAHEAEMLPLARELSRRQSEEPVVQAMINQMSSQADCVVASLRLELARRNLESAEANASLAQKDVELARRDISLEGQAAELARRDASLAEATAARAAEQEQQIVLFAGFAEVCANLVSSLI